MVKTIVFVILIRLHHYMVKTIVFVILIIILSFFPNEV